MCRSMLNKYCFTSEVDLTDCIKYCPPPPDGEGEVHGGGHGEAAHDDDPHEAGGQELEGGVLQETKRPAQVFNNFYWITFQS